MNKYDVPMIIASIVWLAAVILGASVMNMFAFQFVVAAGLSSFWAGLAMILTSFLAVVVSAFALTICTFLFILIYFSFQELVDILFKDR